METPDLKSIISEMQDTSKSSYQRSRAFDKFLEDPSHMQELSVVQSLLHDEERSFRNDVVRSLVRHVVPEYFPLLATALDDADEYVQREALRGLTSCTEPEVMAKVKALAETASYSLKSDSERTLKAMEDAMAALADEPRPQESQGAETIPSVAPETDTAEAVPVVSPQIEPDLPPELPPVSQKKSAQPPPPVPPPIPPPVPPAQPKKKKEKPHPKEHYTESGRHRGTAASPKPKDSKRERSSCGPITCGCLVLAAILALLLAFFMVFSRVETKSSSYPTFNSTQLHNAPDSASESVG